MRRSRYVARAGHLAGAAFAIGLSAAGAQGLAQGLDWRKVTQSDKSALADAIPIGSEDNLALYACRGDAGAGVHPGRFRKDFDGCHIGLGGKEISVMPFEILTSEWQDGSPDAPIPPHSLMAGQRTILGSEPGFKLVPLHPCRASFQGSVQVGEVAADDKGCSFGFGGRQVTEQKYQVLLDAPWMTWAGGIPNQIPADAVAAGSENGEKFYVCRASDQTGLHPGKVKNSAIGCSVVTNGREVVVPQFAVLTLKWLPGNAGTVPVAALPAGYERQDLLYVCRAQVRTTVQLGKLSEQLASCHIGMMGGETATQSYDVLSER